MQRTRPVNFILVATLFVAFLNSSQIASAQANERSNSLDQIVEKFGGTWIGKGASPQGGEFTSKLIFQWTLNRNFIKVENLVQSNGPQELFALTIYGWQPVLRQVVFWSFDNSGAINEGIAEISENTLRHEWRSFEKNGEIKDWQSTVTRHSADSLTFTITDVQRKETYKIEYERDK